VLPEPPTDAEKACYPWRSLPSLAAAARLPSVDILLPVCGEPAEVLRNAWAGVLQLIAAYPGEARGHVLDDGPDPNLMPMAAGFGFSYLRRPDLRWRRNAGNLSYAFARTSGQHIAIFDAGFRPRPDFLAETLPYLDDPAVGSCRPRRCCGPAARRPGWSAPPAPGSRSSTGPARPQGTGSRRRSALARTPSTGAPRSPRPEVHAAAPRRGLAYRA
jgi:hypothetical protein